MEEQIDIDKWFFPLTSFRIGYSPPNDSPTLLLIPGCETFYILVKCWVLKPRLWRRVAAKLAQIRRLLLLKLAVFCQLMLKEREGNNESSGGRLSLIEVSWEDVRKINHEVKHLTNSSLALETKMYKREFENTRQAASFIVSLAPERYETYRNSIENALGRHVDSTGVPGNINPEENTEGDGLILLTFDNRRLLSELKEIFSNSEDGRLLSLVDSGIPSWAMFMQSNLFYHLYRPWMPQLVKGVGLLISIVTVLIAFHDYYDTQLLKMFVESSMICVRGLFKLVASPVIISIISYFLQAIKFLLVWRKPLIKLMRFPVSIWMFCLSVLTEQMVELLHKMVNSLVHFCSNTFEVIKEFSIVISTSLEFPFIVDTVQMIKKVFVSFIRFSAKWFHFLSPLLFKLTHVLRIVTSCVSLAFSFFECTLSQVLMIANWCNDALDSIWSKWEDILKIIAAFCCNDAFRYLWSKLLDLLNFSNWCIVGFSSLWPELFSIWKITNWCNNTFWWLWPKLLDILPMENWFSAIGSLWSRLSDILKMPITFWSTWLESSYVTEIASRCLSHVLLFIGGKLSDLWEFANWCNVALHSLWPKLTAILKITSWCNDAFLFLWSKLLDILKFTSQCVSRPLLFLWGKLSNFWEVGSWLHHLQIQKLKAASLANESANASACETQNSSQVIQDEAVGELSADIQDEDDTGIQEHIVQQVDETSLVNAED